MYEKNTWYGKNSIDMQQIPCLKHLVRNCIYNYILKSMQYKIEIIIFLFYISSYFSKITFLRLCNNKIVNYMKKGGGA